MFVQVLPTSRQKIQECKTNIKEYASKKWHVQFTLLVQNEPVTYLVTKGDNKDSAITMNRHYVLALNCCIVKVNMMNILVIPVSQNRGEKYDPVTYLVTNSDNKDSAITMNRHYVGEMLPKQINWTGLFTSVLDQIDEIIYKTELSRSGILEDKRGAELSLSTSARPVS